MQHESLKWDFAQGLQNVDHLFPHLKKTGRRFSSRPEVTLNNPRFGKFQQNVTTSRVLDVEIGIGNPTSWTKGIDMNDEIQFSFGSNYCINALLITW